MNKHLLQIKLTPAEYQAIIAKLVSTSPIADNYWQYIPNYVIARCPLCGVAYSAQLDTYSLKYWVRPGQGNSVFREHAQEIGCPHFVAVHYFINLNGVMPTELHYKDLGCEVPYVLPVLLPDDIESYAVMHALPICQIEKGRSVPRYSLYMITYYSEAPSVLIERRWQIAPGWNFLIGPGYFLRKEKEAWDLLGWVRAGKLQWLDPETPDLPLRVGPIKAFPYVNSQGRREESNVYRDGKWEDQSFLGRVERFIHGR